MIGDVEPKMIISNWNVEHTEKFRKETFKIKHDLISTGLFSDEALSELLDKHPKDQLDVCALSNHCLLYTSDAADE